MRPCLPSTADITPSHCISNWGPRLFLTRSPCEWCHNVSVCSIGVTEALCPQWLSICLSTFLLQGFIVWQCGLWSEKHLWKGKKIHFFKGNCSHLGFLAHYFHHLLIFWCSVLKIYDCVISSASQQLFKNNPSPKCVKIQAETGTCLCYTEDQCFF